VNITTPILKEWHPLGSKINENCYTDSNVSTPLQIYNCMYQLKCKRQEGKQKGSEMTHW